MFSPWCDARVVKIPQLGALVLRVPLARTRRGSEKTRSLARAFSSSRRAPPMQASKPNSAMASSRVTDWCLLRDSSGDAQHDRAAGHRIFDRAHDQPLAQFGRAAVAKGDDLGKVVSGIDVQQREREAAGRNAFSARRSSTIESLPPENSRAGLAHWPATSRRMWMASASSQSRWLSRRTLVGRQRRRFMKPARSRMMLALLGCSPHSLVSACSHHQRPAWTSSPTAIARVQGSAADARIGSVVQGVVRHVVAAQVVPHFGFGPVGERVEFVQAVLLHRAACSGKPSARRRLLRAQAGDPGRLPAARVAAARPCARRSSALRIVDRIVKAVDAVRVRLSSSTRRRPGTTYRSAPPELGRNAPRPAASGRRSPRAGGRYRA